MYETELISFALELAREAGALLMHYFRRDISVHYKGQIDLVTEADIAAEKLIAARISARFPRHQLLAEEGHGFAGDSGFKWVVDPLDGTTNFAHRLPCFCVSIALEYCGEIILGTVYNPVLDEMFHAARGGGAFLNGKRIRVSATERLTDSLLATGFPYDIRSSQENNLDHFSLFAVHSRAVRRAGAAALDLAYVADGRFDGFWELKLAPWDMAAGGLIVEEAGGRVTDFSGHACDIYQGQLLASNGLVHDEMLRFLGREVKS